MEKNCFVPLPVNFNCWKHHVGFLTEQILTIKSEKEIKELRTKLLKIGESQMDLYYGKLSPTKISDHIIHSLKEKNLLSPEQYTAWLKSENKDFKLMELSDKSLWTLRLSENPDRYVHIHPGRYSPLTIRVKATTLKTIILILSFKKASKIEDVNTETVNQIRISYLNESPLKSLSKASGLIKLIDLFQLNFLN